MYDQVIEALRQSYDASADEREKGEQNGWKLRERQAFLELLLQEEKTNLLEIGAGPGKDSKFFQDSGLQVVASDLSPQMVQLCREKGLEAHVMDFKNLDFAAERFDAVYALNCLLHVPKKDLPDILATIKRLLKPSGLFYMAIYGGQDSEAVWEEDNHRPKRFFSFYSDEQISKISSSLFDIHDFKIITPDNAGEGLHVQRLILRKTCIRSNNKPINSFV